MEVMPWDLLVCEPWNRDLQMYSMLGPVIKLRCVSARLDRLIFIYDVLVQ